MYSQHVTGQLALFLYRSEYLCVSASDLFRREAKRLEKSREVTCRLPNIRNRNQSNGIPNPKSDPGEAPLNGSEFRTTDFQSVEKAIRRTGSPSYLWRFICWTPWNRCKNEYGGSFPESVMDHETKLDTLDIDSYYFADPYALG
ncbi:MAG: hypothetical protein FJ267_16745 [Planctomycetes bacterium]|nr:hypothetical protein [Planctomycetota bacterium]